MIDPKPYKTEVLSLGTNEYRKIKAWQSKCSDGASTNYKEGTPAGDRTLTERRFIPNDKAEPVRYTNFW
jgi:hypothetical protein